MTKTNKISFIIILVCGIFASFSANAACKVGGCSGELCEDDKSQPMASICIWSEEYACYKTAKCETQASGECGWTQSKELTDCIADKRVQHKTPMKPMEAK